MPSRQCRGDCLALRSENIGDADSGQIEHRAEFIVGKSMSFRRTLHLDKSTGLVHDDVHVGLGFGVFCVVKVSTGMPQ